MPGSPQFLNCSDGNALAYELLPGTSAGAPGVIFLHGLMSDRGGTKAEALAAHARRRGYSFLRFDVFGHGASSGRFEEGTISRWTDDAIAVLDRLTRGPQILVGSSMGGWVMLKAALARPERIKGLIGIAAAPDFSEDLMWAGFSEAQRAALMEKGVLDVASDYDPRPYPISRAFIEDGRRNLIMREKIPLSCPVRLLHGQRDTSVPWQTSLKLAEQIQSEDAEVLLIKDGDHRLSRPQDLVHLCRTLDDLVTPEHV
jgi:pimeloyl-ACP methyl ester carboxylesterase